MLYPWLFIDKNIIVNTVHLKQYMCSIWRLVATYSSTLAWKIPWLEEPGRLQPMGLQRVGHNWAASLHYTTHSIVWRKKYITGGLIAPWGFYLDHFLLQCMKVKSESEVAQFVQLLATPWAAAYQAPPSMGFSRQEYWSGLPLPSLVFIPRYLIFWCDH